MRIFLIILITLFTGGCTSTQQTTFEPNAVSYRPSALPETYSLQWSGTNEAILDKGGYYLVQSATDTNSEWKDLSTRIKPGGVNYSYTLQPVEIYFRVKVVGLEVFNLPAIKLVIQNRVTIINAVNKSNSLAWTVTSTSNVDYYYIEKSDGKNWSKTTSVYDRGRPGDYTYRLSKTVKKYTYRLTTFFKNGKSDKPITFT